MKVEHGVASTRILFQNDGADRLGNLRGFIVIRGWKAARIIDADAVPGEVTEVARQASTSGQTEGLLWLANKAEALLAAKIKPAQEPTCVRNEGKICLDRLQRARNLNRPTFTSGAPIHRSFHRNADKARLLMNGVLYQASA